jgi:hypothetical protein
LIQLLAFGFIFEPKLEASAIEWLAAHTNAGSPPPGDDELTEALDLATSEAMAAAGPRQICLGLSSGIDSRLLLHFLRRAGVKVNAITVGQPGLLDFDLPHLLSREIGFEHKRIDTLRADWRRPPPGPIGGRRTIGLSPAQTILRASVDAMPDAVFIHGYLNDAITGAHQPDSLSATWEVALSHFCARNDPFRFQKFILDQIPALLPTRPPFAAERVGYDLQTDLIWRQWQRIKPDQSSGSTLTLTPFAHPQWVRLWLRATPEDLAQQRHLIGYLRRLKADEFWDFQLFPGNKRSVRKATAKYIYRKRLWPRARTASSTRKHAPRDPLRQYDLSAIYRWNPSFKDFLDDAINGLRRHRIFDDAFVTAVMQRFADGDPEAERLVCGCYGINSAAESGWFD